MVLRLCGPTNQWHGSKILYFYGKDISIIFDKNIGFIFIKTKKDTYRVKCHKDKWGLLYKIGEYNIIIDFKIRSATLEYV